MSDGFVVCPPDLRAHAAALERQADRIGTVWWAADSSAGLSADSFGILCRFFALSTAMEIGRAKRCIDGLRDAVYQMAGGVRDTAEVYGRADEANRAIFEGGR